MAINLRNNVTGTGLNLVTNPILKSSATNPVNIGVKTPVNQYKTEDPRYANKTQVNTQVKTPVQTTKPMTPVNQTQVQTQVQTPVNNNQSRFIGFQAPTLQDSLNILQQRQQTSKKKENLTIPTLQNTNTKNANTYIQQMKVVQDFEADVYKNQGKMTKEQIAKLYPEFSNKLDKAMDFQKNLRPIVKNGEYVDETQIRKYFPEFLGNPNLQPKKELEKQAKSIDDENKKIFNKAKNVNQDLLSYNGKVFANFMSELSNLPNQVRKQYNINSDATDSDIITYLYNNDKNFKQEFDRIQNLELTDQDKARLGVGGMWLNRFNVGVSDAISSANEWYQKNVSQPLSDVPLVGAVAQTAGTALAGADKTLTNLGKLTNGEFNNVSDIAGAGIKTIGGGMEAAFGTAYLPATLGFNVVGQSEAGQKVLENTVGLVPSGVTAVFQNTPLLKDFYNSLDEEAQADLSNEIAIALLQGAGAGAKKVGLDIKAGVAADAIANALQRGKYAAKFQIFVEKGLANDKTGKFQKGALGRIFKEGGKEFEQAMKDNFSRFNEVVEARKQARDFKTAPVDNTNLEDNRTVGEKVKSEIKNTAEAVKEKAVEINNNVKNSFSNLLDRKFSTKQQQGNIEGNTAGGSNVINGNNYSQKSSGVNTKQLNSIQKYELQNNNRMNPKAIQTFEERYGESYGQFMYDRGFTKGGEDNLNDMVTYQKDLMNIKENALNKIDGKFNDETISDMLEVLEDYYTKTKDRKNLPIVENWIKEHENGGLSMAEINKARKKFQYDIRTNFYKDGNAEKTQLANNVYLGVKDFLDKTAKENGLDSLDEINREIQKVQHIIGGVSYKMRGSSANNPISLTDWITLASMVDSPSGLALFLGKKLTESSWYTNNKLKYLVGGRKNAKNRITAEKMQGQLERIAKINDEKARNKELEKFYNTYIKPVKELSEYFDNSVAEFKKQFNEMVEEGTLDNALPDLRESDVKSGKKNLVTSKNQVTIEADEKGNARRKGQISEVDKRNEDNKKGGYDNKPTEPTKPKKPAPTQPKNSVTSKKEEKTNMKKEHEQKTEKTAHKEEPVKENSKLKDAVGDDYYNWLERQLEIINDSRKGNKEPLKLEDLDIGSDIYLAEFEKLHREKLKSLQQELSDLNINQADTKLTPKQQKMLEQAKSEEERQGLLEKWRREYLEKNQMSDEDIAKVENIMNKAHELVEQREKYYNYILDWTEKKNAKDKVTNTKNAVTSKKQETATEFMDRLERENAEDIKAQQSDLFNMPETEDIEAIDKELTARQQEDLKNMPETEDVEVIDKEIEKNKVTAKYNEEDTTIGQITKHLKDKEKGMRVYKDSEGRIIGQSLVDFNYSAFNIKDRGNTSRVMIQRESADGENIYWMIDPYITEKGIKDVNTLLKNVGVDNYHLELRKNTDPYPEFENKVFVINEKTGNEKELSKKYSYDFQGKTNLHNTEITLKRNAEEQAQFEKELAEKQAKREKEKAEYEERQRQKEEEKKRLQAEEDKKREPIKGYLEENYKTPLQRGKVKENLTKKITWNDDNGKFRVGMTFQWLDELAEKDGEFGEVMVTNTKSQPVYKYDNKGYRLNKTEADYLRYKINEKAPKEGSISKEQENELFKKEAQVEKPKNLVTNPPKEESKIDKILKESEGQELKVINNGDNRIVMYKVNGEDRAYTITKEQLDEVNSKKNGKSTNTEPVKETTDKPKNLVTEKTKQESNTKTVKIQDIDKDTYYNDIMKNPKDHPREMFIYKDGNYYYPSYILPSGKIITPENTYWGEVSSEEAARNWLQQKAEEHSVENETKKTERLKNMVGKTAEKYEETLKRIESDNPMQEIRTRGDYFKYGTSNSQMAKAKKEADANAEVGTFKKDVIDGKEGYRIFVSGSKQDAIRAFYEPKTGKAYRIYRGPTISDAKPFTTREVDRIEKFLGNVEKQLEKETKREKPQEKTYITQEWLDNTKPDNDGVIELDSKSDEMRALRQGKESLIKEGKADGKYLQNYGGEKYPQYLAVYIKDGEVYEGRKGLEDQYMSTKQEAVDWLNQKEKDVEHEATAWYNERDYEPLPKTISVESEAEKAGPKRIAPDRVKWQQETYDKGLENVKNVLKASPVKLYELGFKSDRSKAVQDIMSERKRIRELPEDIAEKQWNELAKSVYEPLVIKDISKGYRYPEDVTSKFPKAQMKKAVDARARYEKGLFTSFSNKDTRANNQYRDEIGAGIKSQDGKPVTQEQMNEIVDGIRSFGGVFGLDMKKFAEDNNIIYVHLHGGNPFLMGGGGKSKGGGMNIAGLYRRGSDGNISISLGGVELVMEKGEDGEMKKNNVNATPEHELAHAFDYMLDNKLFSSQDIEILKKTMNKPTRLINYYNRSQEIVARAVEQYAAKKTGKSRYGRPYKDAQAYWNEENFDKYVKPIVEKNMKEKLKEYQLDNSKKNVISNGKNKITSK